MADRIPLLRVPCMPDTGARWTCELCESLNSQSLKPGATEKGNNKLAPELTTIILNPFELHVQLPLQANDPHQKRAFLEVMQSDADRERLLDTVAVAADVMILVRQGTRDRVGFGPELCSS